MHRTKLNMDMTEGALFWKIFRYSVPLILTGMLQVTYNVMDTVVVGKFGEDTSSLAAVGSTGSLNNLIINLLFGLSVGTSVLVSQYYGAKQYKNVSRTVHTSLFIAFIGGISVATLGIIFAKPLLTIMSSPPDVIDKATLYMRLIFSGLPASAVFNFGAAVLRARGDTKRPLMILGTTGILDVILNFVFVINVKLDVAGVAISTVMANYLSAIAVVIILYRTDEAYKFRFKNLCIDSKILKKMALIGLPAGIQGMMFSFSAVLIQSSINTFPTNTIAGNAASSSIEGLTYSTMNSFYHTCLTFTGQNFGAQKYDRMNKVLLYSLVQVCIVGIIVAQAALFFGMQLTSLFTDIDAVKDAAMVRLRCIMATHLLCGIMEVLVGRLRGIGYSLIPMISSLVGACLFRVAWIIFVFPIGRFNCPMGLYLTFPLSWLVTIILHLITILYTRKSSLKRKLVDSDSIIIAPEPI